jgi:phage shock protein C
MNGKRQLRLSRNRLLVGVCAGLGEYFGADVVFVRLMFAMTTAASAMLPGVVIYLCLWFFMAPPEGDGPQDA